MYKRQGQYGRRGVPGVLGGRGYGRVRVLLGRRLAGVGHGCVEGALAEGRGVGRSPPQLLQLLVQPGQGEGDAGHVEAGDEFADLGVDDLHPGLPEEGGDLAVDDEQFLVLDRAEAVEDDGGALPPRPRDVLGEFLQQGVHQQPGRLVGGRQRFLADAGLPVDAEADGHAGLGDGEEGVVGAGQGAAGEGDAEGAGAGAGPFGDAHHVVQGETLLGRGGGRLEDGQVTGDAAALGGLVGTRARHVVGDGEGPGVDAVGGQALGGLPEVQDVTGVVAVHQQHTGAAVGGPGDRADLLGGGRGEDVADRGAVGQSASDQAGEGRVVPRAAADHDGDLSRRGAGRPDDAARDGAHPAPVRGGEPFQRLVGEGGGVVEQAGHRKASMVRRSGSGVGSSVRWRVASRIIRTADSSMKKPTR